MSPIFVEGRMQPCGRRLCTPELEHINIYKNLIYYQNINMDAEPDLQLLIQSKLFIPLQ